jgi:hypothetical protein
MDRDTAARVFLPHIGSRVVVEALQATAHANSFSWSLTTPAGRSRAIKPFASTPPGLAPRPLGFCGSRRQWANQQMSRFILNEFKGVNLADQIA